MSYSALSSHASACSPPSFSTPTHFASFVGARHAAAKSGLPTPLPRSASTALGGIWCAYLRKNATRDMKPNSPYTRSLTGSSLDGLKISWRQHARMRCPGWSRNKRSQASRASRASHECDTLGGLDLAAWSRAATASAAGETWERGGSVVGRRESAPNQCTDARKVWELGRTSLRVSLRLNRLNLIGCGIARFGRFEGHRVPREEQAPPEGTRPNRVKVPAKSV